MNWSAPRGGLAVDGRCTRRELVLAPLPAGFALGTDVRDLVAGAAAIAVQGGTRIPGNGAMPERTRGRDERSTVLGVQEVLGVHESFRELCRRFAHHR